VRKNGVVTYLLSDHLGSNSLITSDTGTLLSETRFKAWGEIRYTSGTTTTPYTYTGQYSNTADFGWMYYKARWYDSALGRFSQADTIVPGAGDPRAWDRYAYVKNSPVVYNDPSGHGPEYITGIEEAVMISLVVLLVVYAGITAIEMVNLINSDMYMGKGKNPKLILPGYLPEDVKQMLNSNTNPPPTENEVPIALGVLAQYCSKNLLKCAQLPFVIVSILLRPVDETGEQNQLGHLLDSINAANKIDDFSSVQNNQLSNPIITEQFNSPSSPGNCPYVTPMEPNNLLNRNPFEQWREKKMIYE
jgi:RHS repeat-associated protein